ncbi:MAG: AAA domain-containing protein [Bacteroidia bacterium]
MFSVLHQYKLRLTNLSQSNRSLRLARLSPRKDIDLSDLGHLNQLSSADILKRIVAGQSVTLVKALSARDEATNLVDRHLNKIWHTVNTLQEESGAYDLFVGYPFVEGKFLDGSVARCPVVLFPVRLVRNLTGGNRWTLEPELDEDLSFNTTFFLAYEKFMKLRLPKEFWEERPERHQDIQGFLNGLYQQLMGYEMAVHFNQELFQFTVDRYPDKNQAVFDQLPIGKLRFLPQAVLGVFPQSDSALLQDYEVLESESEAFNIEEVFPVPSNAKLSTPKEEERFFVEAVDQSQEDALLHVRSGESVVVHGPPGTGKSQVIVNLVSDALARGQRVLVCSQKRAALDVVHQRLGEAGLARFAALVHDFRADRNKIFARIRKQIDEIEAFKSEQKDLGIHVWAQDLKRDSKRIDEFNANFEALHQALSQRSRFGMSAHELYLATDRNGASLDMGPVASLFDLEAWRAFREKLAALMDYQELFDPAHPWETRIPLNRQGLTAREAILGSLRGLDTQINALHSRWQRLGTAGKSILMSYEIPGLLTQFAGLEEGMSRPGAHEDLAAAVTDGLKPKFLRDQLSRLGKLFGQFREFRILNGLPLSQYEEHQRQFSAYQKGLGSIGRFFSGEWWKGRKYVRQLFKRRGLSVDPGNLARLEEEIATLSGIMEVCLKMNKYAFFADIPLTGAPNELIEWQAQKLVNVDLYALWLDWEDFRAFRPVVSDGALDEAAWRGQVSDARELGEILQGMEAMERGVAQWLHPRQVARFAGAFSNPEEARGRANELITALEQDYEHLRQVDGLLDSLAGNQRLAWEHLLPHVLTLEKGDMLHQSEQGMYRAWLDLVEAANPVLLEVSSRQMPDRLDAYRKLVHERQRTVAGLVQRKLKDAIVDAIEYNRLNNPVTFRDIAHQVGKQRQLWPVRKLVQKFWDEGLSTLMPCWLASPESVSAIFPMVKGYFDLVVFDEASQCYAERALPVMLRGKQFVIAGDDKQLPPFDLYNVKADEEEDPFVEDQAALEVESVLDLARTRLLVCKLDWHYRSSERELIDFSNHAFYEGRLNVIPRPQHEAISQPPISFERVEGRWESNANRPEAERVVAIVEDLIARPDAPTVGVVTFNYHQKELITTLLEERLEALRGSGDTERLKRLLTALDVPEGEERQGLFVKNIENVQGDERDVMVFSVGYARNAAGKLMTNFGLLNQKGGGNRLNVAITRARKKKIVVCSFDPEELRVEDAKHDGPGLLKRYLQYARAVSMGEPATNVAGDVATESGLRVEPWMTSGVTERLLGMLKARGLNVEPGDGEGGFGLDLMVRGKDGDYVLGIECEGRNYFSGRTPKEREVYRPGLLARRGWRLHRVWARNFFLDPEAEVNRIVAAVEAAAGS